MRTSITREQARRFAARWRIAAEAEAAELRATPLARKLEQLAALMASARALGWATEDPAEVQAIRARWMRLIAEHRGRPAPD